MTVRVGILQLEQHRSTRYLSSDVTVCESAGSPPPLYSSNHYQIKKSVRQVRDKESEKITIYNKKH